MPLYEYHCTKCGHRFEKIQSFSAKQETVCPQCGGVLERPLNAPAFQFKGSGWYVNDYGGNHAASSGATASSESSSEAKPAAESKPAAKSSPKAESKPAPAAAPSAT